MFEFTMADLANRVRQEAARQGIDPETAVAALIAENTADGKFDPDRKISTKTTSHRGAIGALQVMPGTFEALKKQGFVAAHHTLDNIEGQIAGGVAALKEIQTRTKDSRPLRLLAEYNGGPKAGAAFASGNFDALHPETQG